MGATHEFESLNGFSEGKGIGCGAIARDGGGGGTRRATGKDGRRRELVLGSDTGAERHAALARPGGILSIGEPSITTPAFDENVV
jgi:hypothetical protein